MRKIALLGLLGVSAASHAIVVAAPFFPTAASMRERFDTIPAGSYLATPVFSSPVIGFAYALNPPGTLTIGVPPGPPAFTVPNTMYGSSTDIGIRVNPPMRRFGGFFRRAVNSAGVVSQVAKFVFYNGSTVIGTQTVPLTNTWTWRGFRTIPQLWDHVEIYGAIPGFPGGVDVDSIRVRPF